MYKIKIGLSLTALTPLVYQRYLTCFATNMTADMNDRSDTAGTKFLLGYVKGYNTLGFVRMVILMIRDIFSVEL